MVNHHSLYILSQLAEHAQDASATLANAQREKQEIGIAETDPALDI